jgi:small basic protein
MLALIVGTIIGILLGFYLPFDIPLVFIKYTAIGILAALDAIFGGWRAQLEHKFVTSKFVISFFSNAALAGLLAALGDFVGVDIYLGAVVAFSIRLFQNLSVIREELLERAFAWGTTNSDLESAKGDD